MPSILTTLDLWRNHLRTIPLADARRADCPACGERRFEFLDRPATGAISLCGRDTIQIRPAPSGGTVDLASLEKRLKAVGTVQRTPYLLRLKVHDGSCSLTVFPDGRAMFHGLRDPAAARSAYARYIGG